MEFAIGSAEKVLGPEFAALDTYPARVRLPDEPLMLVDRILTVEGEKGGMGSGRVVTEHDVFENAWYLDGGRAPVCISVEAGQADLFLCSYLGIDLQVKGTRTYRLLDATVHFHRPLPRPGETIRYDIRIDRFIRTGQTWMFFFEFDGTIDGEPLITMRKGCAGFFTEEEVKNSGGIILTEAERNVPPGTVEAPELIPMARESYDDRAVDALRRGDLAAAFGPAFSGVHAAESLRLPGGRMRLIHRVLELDPAGGRFGVGIVRAEADIHPDDWFLTCHFVDDMVMPGTLMYECCAHTLRVFLQRMGWVVDREGPGYEPVLGVHSILKCRGPVTPQTRSVIYEVELKKIAFHPEPHVIADANMYADGRPIVRFVDMGMRLAGVTEEELIGFWGGRIEETGDRSQKSVVGSQGPEVSTRKSVVGNQAPEARIQNAHGSGVKASLGETREEDSQAWKSAAEETRPVSEEPPRFTREQLLAFCEGNPSECFGAPYRVFDEERRIARLPRPPYFFMDRVVSTEPEPWALKPGGWIESEYQVPPDAWYFGADRSGIMPYCVLLEIALQPCGFLAAYVGSALRSQQDLKFRNLGGEATLHRNLHPECGKLTVRCRMTKASEAGGMIIENFDMVVLENGQPVYEGTTYFGFFTEQALANQVGLTGPDAKAYVPDEAETARGQAFDLEVVAPLEPVNDALVPMVDGKIPPAPTFGKGEEPESPPFVKGDLGGFLGGEISSETSFEAGKSSPVPGTKIPPGPPLKKGGERVEPFYGPLSMPAKALLNVDRIDLYVPDGGPNGLGFVRGVKEVDPAEWFFQAHFYQDPVMPGSLGIEAFIQLLRFAALQRWPHLAETHRFEILSGEPQTWVYRGQIIQRNRLMTVEASVTDIEDGDEPVLRAEGRLLADGLPIYAMRNFGVRLVRVERE
jgi:3-hydroxymyristoyl/3-hydroxydecanoyl-(acyl carrier protein) dehydratase